MQNQIKLFWTVFLYIKAYKHSLYYRSIVPQLKKKKAYESKIKLVYSLAFNVKSTLPVPGKSKLLSKTFCFLARLLFNWGMQPSLASFKDMKLRTLDGYMQKYTRNLQGICLRYYIIYYLFVYIIYIILERLQNEWLWQSSLFKRIPTTHIPSSYYISLLPDHSWLDSDSSPDYIQAGQ